MTTANNQNMPRGQSKGKENYWTKDWLLIEPRIATELNLWIVTLIVWHKWWKDWGSAVFNRIEYIHIYIYIYIYIYVYTLALDVWGESHLDASPTGSAATSQKAWVQPVIDAQFSSLFQGSSPKCKARLLASQRKESGAWLNAPPITALGLRMEDIVISTAVGLCLGLPLCSRHVCHQCGKEVDESGTHGLSCRRSQGRHPRHFQLNEVVKRLLAAAKIPAVLEPRGLCTANDSRPDGLTLIPWSRGRSLVWDITVHAPSNIGLSNHGAGRLADQAARQKLDRYQELTISHFFVPLAMETTGVFGEQSMAFVQDLSRRIWDTSGEIDEFSRLCQRICVCIQRCNSAAILGTLPPSHIDYDDELCT